MENVETITATTPKIGDPTESRSAMEADKQKAIKLGQQALGEQIHKKTVELVAKAKQKEQEEAQLRRFMLELAKEKAAGPKKRTNKAAQYLGHGRYKVGDQFICLTGNQADVLEMLVELRAATLAQLAGNGVSNPSAVLTSVCNNHRLLAPFIKLPGGKGKGGYSTTITDGRMQT